jgi:hypothetical protein
MADDQPGERARAAGPAQPSAPAADPTRVEPAETERSTVDAPARWSGWAAVPPPAPRRSLWSLRRTPPAPPDRPMSSEATDWAATPAVDPWAGHDTPWDPMPMVPPELPPTRPEEPLPPTRLDPQAALPPPAPPPAALPPAAPPQAALPPPAPPQAALPPIAAPPVAPPPVRRRRWGAKKPPQPAPTANRIPIATRPPAPPPARPQAWRPPPQARRPLPPPPRRRRHWGRRFALFTLFSVVCCCGVPVAYLSWSPARQYPVRAVLPASVADLSLRDDSASRRAVARLTHDLTDAKADQVFAGVYGDGNGKRVTVFGTTGFRLTPGSDVKAELDHLTSDYDLRDIATYEVGEPGAHERCGVGDTGGTSVVVCSWADHGSLATVVTTRRSAADSAALTAILRNAVLTRP